MVRSSVQAAKARAAADALRLCSTRYWVTSLGASPVQSASTTGPRPAPPDIPQAGPHGEDTASVAGCHSGVVRRRDRNAASSSSRTWYEEDVEASDSAASTAVSLFA